MFIPFIKIVIKNYTFNGNLNVIYNTEDSNQVSLRC